ncbi:MAG: hypothetical protein ABEJ93_00840 [Candidatus Nanohalobium sp.]
MFSGIDLHDRLPDPEDDESGGELSRLKGLLSSGSNSGTVRPEIRERVYDTGYSSPENVTVCDQDQLERDVREAIYDLGNNPDNWYDDVMKNIRKVAEAKDGNLNGGDVKNVLNKYRTDFDEFGSDL